VIRTGRACYTRRKQTTMTTIDELETKLAALTAEVQAMKAQDRPTVGDWVEMIDPDGLDVHFDVGEKVKIERDDNSAIPYYAKGQWFMARRVQKTTAPVKPALKYKAGDIVLVPMVIDEVDTTDVYTYLAHPLGDGNDDEQNWYTRAALEPERPSVGDRVVAFDRKGQAYVGALTRLDEGDSESYKVKGDGFYLWFPIAYKLPAE